MPFLDQQALAAIRHEIETDPEGLGYAAILPLDGYWGVAKLANDTSRRPGPFVALVGRAAIKRVMLARGILLPILGDTSHASAQAAKYFMSDSDFASINLDDSAYLWVVAGLKADNFVDDDDIAAVRALGDRTQSRSQELGMDPWTPDDVRTALGGE